MDARGARRGLLPGGAGVDRGRSAPLADPAAAQGLLSLRAGRPVVYSALGPLPCRVGGVVGTPAAGGDRGARRPRAGWPAAARCPAARRLRHPGGARVLSAGTLPSVRAGPGGSRAGRWRARPGHRTASIAGPADRRMSVLVVIPTYNERGNLPDLVRAIMAHEGFRVLVVDDGSPDGTGEAADALA